ncbi:MAG: nucleoside hydrolase [Armatimonadota bacterium]|nr:nucleoside hydrolase [Armatimonadota bacterium]
MQTVPLLFDTDIGSDIDDAVALAYLLKQPRCELLGITTVTGEPERRASLASAVCRAAGRTDIPIHVGTEAPLLNPQRQPHATQAEALTDEWPHANFGKENTAVRFLQDTIRARPGELTLLTVGPLTNIALLFALDPEIPSLLKQLVMMGGWFFSKTPDGRDREWNILCDPHAAARVFMAPIDHFKAVGIDVTGQCQIPADECRQRFKQAGGPLAPVAAMAEVWFRDAAAITFHDPLAAAVVFDESLCQFKPGHVEVELDGFAAGGRTLVSYDSSSQPHQLASGVEPERFFEHYFSVVG